MLAKLRRALDQPVDEADRRDDEKQDELFHAASGRSGSRGIGDGFAHGGIRLDILHSHVVHDAEVAGSECLGHRERHLGLGLHDLGLHFLGAGFHFLLGGDSGSAAHFGFGLRDAAAPPVYALVARRDLAAGEEARFTADMEALGALPMYSTPRASSAISDIRGFIGMVIDKGFAYQSGGSVYFDVTQSKTFGEISHYSQETMIELARERGGNVEDPHKRHPLDFVLWHPSAVDEPSWETMWGPGRPGWHIECSALALRELGTTIDLHGGGSDLIFPHHECERAQSEAATEELFVKHWMHVAMVSMDGHKMSKSRGNLVFVDKLRTRFDPRVIRLGLIEHHYRFEWEWDEAMFVRNVDRLANWSAGTKSDGGELLGLVREALDDDLDTPRAVTLIDAAAKNGVDVSTAANLLGVTLVLS